MELKNKTRTKDYDKDEQDWKRIRKADYRQSWKYCSWKILFWSSLYAVEESKGMFTNVLYVSTVLNYFYLIYFHFPQLRTSTSLHF